MFVRWKKGKGKLYCYLCESKRIAGKPVTKTLGALGHYPDNASEIEKQQFWQQVDSKLLQFSVPDAEQIKIKTKIAERVPRYVASASQMLTLEHFLEEFPDGVLLVSTEEKIIHQNQNAQSLLKYLFPDEMTSGQVPSVIWQSCQSVMNKGDTFSQGSSATEHSIRLSDSQSVRIRTQWFQGTAPAVPCLWVSLQIVDDISNLVKDQGELNSSKVSLINSLEKTRGATVGSARSASVSRASDDTIAIQKAVPPHEASSQAISDTTTSTDMLDMQSTLLLAAIESFTVGLMVVAQNGTILHSNSRAQALLKQLSSSASDVIPDRIRHACESLIDFDNESSNFLSLEHKIVLEDEISTTQGTILIKTQRFNWESQNHKDKNCFLITLEDREQSLIDIAKQEAQRYGLSPRETDVWCLKRLDKSYKEIAQTLFISESTVKKHLKNIYARKEESKWLT